MIQRIKKCIRKYASTCNYTILLCCSVGIIIMFYVDSINDYLGYDICKNPKISLWQVSHFLLFFVAGKLCPNKFWLFFVIGVLWEIIEASYGYMTDSLEYWTSDGIHGQAMDVAMNTLGYYIAHIL